MHTPALEKSIDTKKRSTLIISSEIAETVTMEGIGNGMTNEARIRLAKRLAKKRMVDFLERGSPKNEPHPDKIYEAKLRKRGIITNDMGESEMKRLCVNIVVCFNEACKIM